MEITWADPYYISADNLDTIIVTALDDSFLGFRGRRSTAEVYVTLSKGASAQKTVPRQLVGSKEEMAQLKAQIAALGTVTNSFVAGGFVINLLLASTLSLLWGLVNVLQVITHLIFLQTNIPQHAYLFNEMLLSAANLDIVPMDTVYEHLFPYLYTAGVQT